MRKLTLRCKACGRRFAIPVVADAFGSPRLGEAEWTCARCGETRRYGTRDYRAAGAARGRDVRLAGGRAPVGGARDS